MRSERERERERERYIYTLYISFTQLNHFYWCYHLPYFLSHSENIFEASFSFFTFRLLLNCKKSLGWGQVWGATVAVAADVVKATFIVKRPSGVLSQLKDDEQCNRGLAADSD